MKNFCDTTNTLLTCVVRSTSSSTYQAELQYIGTGITTITYLEMNVYASVGSTFGVAADYTVTVRLPTYDSTISYYVPFGNSYSSANIYC